MQTALDHLIDWTQQWGLQVSTTKTYYQIFTKKRLVHLPTLTIHNTPIQHVREHKYLGMHLDSPSLTWTAHIQHLKQTTQPRLAILKALTGTTWGAHHKILLRFYTTYIRSQIDYCCQAYASAAPTNLQSLEVIQNNAMRLICGAMRSTPILGLYGETGLTSLATRRDIMCANYLLLCTTAHQTHPYRSKINPTVNPHNPRFPTNHSQPFLTRATNNLNIDLSLLQNSETQLTVPPIPPWLYTTPNTAIQLEDNIPKSAPNSAIASVFLSTMKNCYPNTTAIYTDGSRIIKNNVPSVTSAVWIPEYHLKQGWRLPNQLSVFTAELYALYQALQIITTLPVGTYTICSDSKSAIQAITYSSKTCKEFVYPCLQLLHEHRLNGYDTSIQWVPAHCGILHNELVDQLAKAMHNTPHITRHPIPHVARKGAFKNTITQDFATKWKTSCSPLYYGSIKKKWETCQI
ncbi:uncharacterized protein [Procambarus clarkii]|uniref:uncharacterized protein n=1 Tax=Procambarus clarkii TaxID=6728 RepID=UPI003744AC75